MAKHNLIEIHRERSSDGMVDTVVRWCTSCGAVVVDGESDGRLSPGHFMPMRRPVLTKRAACGDAALAQQPAAAVPASACPHSTRCHCIGVCKYGTAVAGAQPESPWLALAGLVEEVDASFDSAEGLAYVEFYPVKPVDKLIAACRELIKAQQPAAAVPKVTLEMIGAGMKEWDTQHSAGVRSWPTMLEAAFLAMLAAAERAQGVGNDHA